MYASDLPDANREAVMRSIGIVREARNKGEFHKIEPIEEVIAEIKHLLDFPGSSLDGLAGAEHQLRNTQPLDAESGTGADATPWKPIPSVAATAEALRERKFDLLGLQEGALTDNQCTIVPNCSTRGRRSAHSRSERPLDPPTQSAKCNDSRIYSLRLRLCTAKSRPTLTRRGEIIQLPSGLNCYPRSSAPSEAALR